MKNYKKISDPIEIFNDWYTEAKKFEPSSPNACCLATTDSKGCPSARMVLIKKIDERGFTFFTNLNSKKAEDFNKNIKVALCFHWKSIGKQVRVEGSIIELPDQEADEYFQSRDRDSKIGAWVSKQSKPLSKGITYLDNEFLIEKKRLDNKKIVRPQFWSGRIVVPEKLEFWKSREHRLHERVLFSAVNKKWNKEYLYP